MVKRNPNEVHVMSMLIPSILGGQFLVGESLMLLIYMSGRAQCSTHDSLGSPS